MDQLTEEYHRERLDHARESHFNRDVQRRELELQDELRKYKTVMVRYLCLTANQIVAAILMLYWKQDRDAFILVLIDGDGMIFDDKFISRGEIGGKEAAQKLWSSVTEFVQKGHLDLPSDFKVVTRIYANIKGLGDVCHRSGIVERPEVLEDFARGFTGSKQLFDFVDVLLHEAYGRP